MILTNGGGEGRDKDNSGNFTIFVEDAFAEFVSYTNDNGGGPSCMIKNKQAIGKYTGMNGMIGETRVTFVQGGGSLYTVIDGSGGAPAHTLLENKQYTVYSRLEITTANGESLEKGTTVKISIPSSAGIN